MQSDTLKIKVRYSKFLVYLLGGISGSALNLIVTVVFYYGLDINPFVSFFFGILFNELFHYIYYYIVFVNKEIRLKTPFHIQLMMYIVVAFAGLSVLGMCWKVLNLHFTASVIVSIIFLALISSLIIKISAFSSAELAHVEYARIDEDYYDNLVDDKKYSRFRSWYHSNRFQRLADLVHKNYQTGMKIADLGCGNCLWNERHLPVTGVDINSDMLKWAQRNDYLQAYVATDDLSKTGLPSTEFDIVIMSEVLEHVFNLEDVLREVRRILKDDGRLLLTVPYDIFMGPFFILFNLNCVYTGFVRGSRYHQLRCGHINHFTQKRIRETLRENGFEVTEMSVINYLLLYITAQKAIK